MPPATATESQANPQGPLTDFFCTAPPTPSSVWVSSTWLCSQLESVTAGSPAMESETVTERVVPFLR